MRRTGACEVGEFDQCGTRVWRRDLVYGGGVLLGAVKNATPVPTVQFAAATSSVSEGTASATATVTLATATPLACPVSVPWQTANGTAVAGQDFTPPADGLVTFPTGSANGATQAAAVTIVNDAIYEPAETFSLVLGTPVGALAGAVSSHTVTIQDNESVPVVSIGNATVSASGGSAVFTVTVSPASAQTITVPYSTVPGTATPDVDYTVPAGSAIQLAPYQLSGTISVPVLPDGLVEPTETFTVSLGTPTNAQLGDGAGLGQILDASSIIDLTLPGRYFADATGGPGADDFIIIANPNSVSLPVVLTFVKPSGAWVRRTFTLGAKNRTALHLAGEPGVGGQGEVSVAVQSADPNYPVAADHAVYWGTNWAAGRSTEGVTPASVWYLPEGGWSGLEEWITVFNPDSGSVNVTFRSSTPTSAC